MNLLIGIGNLLMGLCYAGLGLLAVWESYSLRHHRGWSRFGLGFALMTASCGPHHVLHGWQALQGEGLSWPLAAAAILGLPAGLVFVGLRIEKLLGGPGDRAVSTTRDWAGPLAAGFAVITGWLGGWTLSRPFPVLPADAVCSALGLAVRSGTWADRLVMASNLFVVVTYGMVGWYLAGHQVRRFVAESAWSLSGVSLSAVFFTCAFTHLIFAMHGHHAGTLLFDLLGIPASVYFLWVVRRLYSDAVVDWNRRPLAGAAVTPDRAAPWAQAASPR